MDNLQKNEFENKRTGKKKKRRKTLPCLRDEKNNKRIGKIIVILNGTGRNIKENFVFCYVNVKDEK